MQTRIGIEIEFGGLKMSKAISLVTKIVGGNLEQDEPYVATICDSRVGTVDLKLDTRFAHHPKKGDEGVFRDIETTAADVVGWLSEGFVPLEIITEPLEQDRIPVVDELVVALRKAGARGASNSPADAFGTHLNMEEKDLSPKRLSRVIKAYLLASDWLRREIEINIPRRILPHIDPFPARYTDLVLASDYDPTLPVLVKDYVRHNPTRNRELDCLPMFAHLMPEFIEETIDDDRVKSRPAWHYRLPGTNLADSSWSVSLEVERWQKVENLSRQPEHLDQLGAEYRKQRHFWNKAEWADRMDKEFS